MTPFQSACSAHLQQLCSARPDADDGMWPSVVNTRSKRCPQEEHVPGRVYRLIGAPRGSTLYWDQPSLVAASRLSAITGDPQYTQAVDRCIDGFLSRCVAADGMFQWGNHTYFDLVEGAVVNFSGGYHELRPITPAWGLFWRHRPEETATYIRTMARRHIYDEKSGGFNRHDDGKPGHAFLEAGGILSESLAWLFHITGEEDLLAKALQVARYSYNHRNPTTGLVPNEPDHGRWDSRVCTSEVGLWAQCLLRAGSYTGCDEFATMARHSLAAYLRYAFNPADGQYAGQVSITGGTPVVPDEAGYWPREHANPWNTDQWPNHDYPMPAAEACLTLHALTGEATFRDTVHRSHRIVMAGRPSKTGGWAYAESYGRCIHFLTRAGLELSEGRFLADAKALAEEALAQLFVDGMFQGYPGDHMYETVDGVGYLLLALLFLETEEEAELFGFGF